MYIQRTVKTTAYIWHENMLEYLTWTSSVPQSSQFSLSFALGKLGTDTVQGKTFCEHISMPNGGYCLFIIWQGSLEGNLSILICSFLVEISPYVQFPYLTVFVFFVFESQQIKNKHGPSAT